MMRSSARTFLLRWWLPASFVVLWSTGFVGGRWGLPHAGPFSLLAVRMAIATVLLAALAWMAGAAWPRSLRDWAALVASGLLTHGMYLGGVFTAIAAGTPTGTVALIVGLQPLLSALLAPLIGQPGGGRQHWLGLALGAVGLALVVSAPGRVAIAPPHALLAAAVALVGITAGALVQKRWVAPIDFRAMAAVQYAVTALAFAVPAAYAENWRLEWSWQLAGALIWLTGALSVGAVALLYRLIRERSMEEVTSLFYATPAVTALMGLALFDERLPLVQWLGFPFVAAAVWLSTRRRAHTSTARAAPSALSRRASDASAPRSDSRQ